MNAPGKIALALSLALSTGLCLADDLALKEYKKIKTSWDEQASGIKAARLKIRAYRFSSLTGQGNLHRAGVGRIIERLAGRTDHASFEAAIDGDPAGGWRKGNSVFWGDPFETVQDGVKIKEVCKSEDRTKQLTRFRDGIVEIEYRPVNNQASVLLSRNSMEKFDVARLRRVPALNEAVIAEIGGFERRDKGMAVLSYVAPDEKTAGHTVEFDEATGFVQHDTVKDKAGFVTSEVWQFHPIKNGRFTLAKLVVEARYEKQSEDVRMISIYALDTIEMNGEIPREEFWVEVPGDTRIVDFLDDRAKPTIHVPPDPVPDVLKYIDLAKRKKMTKN